jgi:hypothetical protein
MGTVDAADANERGVVLAQKGAIRRSIVGHTSISDAFAGERRYVVLS